MATNSMGVTTNSMGVKKINDGCEDHVNWLSVRSYIFWEEFFLRQGPCILTYIFLKVGQWLD